ncbi:hypothetical protein HK103_005042 [Boothiomyces macroporosus]|uniref:Uncharacterized protein n=1 Tax=Boothiomyces macroporosus TaxID=261099 RepID=A0AAD5UJH5_9FUNG|nr:hypothetical protein HK103_005042 [Boothiomyces macroporosus]
MSVQEQNPLNSPPSSSTSRSPPPILTTQRSKGAIEIPRTNQARPISSYADPSSIASPITPKMHNRIHSHLFEGAMSPTAPSPITKPRRDNNNSWVGVGVSVEENSKGQPVIRNSYQHVSKRPSAEQILYDDMKKPISGTLATIYPIGADDDNDPYAFRIMDPTPVGSHYPSAFETPVLDRNTSKYYTTDIPKDEKNKSLEAIANKNIEKSDTPTKKVQSDEKLNEKKIANPDGPLKEKPTSDQDLKSKDVERVPLQDVPSVASPRLLKTKSRSSFLAFLKKREGSTDELNSSKGELKDKETEKKHKSFFFAKRTSSSNLLDDQKAPGSSADINKANEAPKEKEKHRSLFFVKKTSSSNLIDDQKAAGSNADIVKVHEAPKEKHRSFFFVKRASAANLLDEHKAAEVPAAPPPPPPTLLKDIGIEPKIEKLKPEIELNKKIATLEKTVKVLQEVVDRLTKENESLKQQLESKVE